MDNFNSEYLRYEDKLPSPQQFNNLVRHNSNSSNESYSSTIPHLGLSQSIFQTNNDPFFSVDLKENNNNFTYNSIFESSYNSNNNSNYNSNYNSNNNSNNNLEKLRHDSIENTNILRNNLDKVVQRQNKINNLENMTENLLTSAEKFKSHSKKIKWIMCKKYMFHICAIITMIIAIIVLIYILLH